MDDTKLEFLLNNIDFSVGREDAVYQKILQRFSGLVRHGELGDDLLDDVAGGLHTHPIAKDKKP